MRAHTTNAYIIVKSKESLTLALRQLKRELAKEGVSGALRRHGQYDKPSKQRRDKRNRAKRRRERQAAPADR